MHMDENKSSVKNLDTTDKELTIPLDENSRQQYLAAMNIPVWLSKNEANLLEEQDNLPVTSDLEPTAIDLTIQKTTQNFTPQEITPIAVSIPMLTPIPVPATTHQITTTSLPTTATTSTLWQEEIQPIVSTIITDGLNLNSEWDSLAQKVAKCQLCPELVANRSRTVFGVGNRQARLLVIGEAPGADEDLQGEPFVGRAGQLLNAMLNAINIQREEVYIANILKCRPPNNRDPQPEEAANCESWLLRQIELLSPQIIFAIGRIAAQNLLNTQIPIGKLRGNIHKYGTKRIPLIATYHPAYLLRSPGQKAEAWKDLQVVAQFLRNS